MALMSLSLSLATSSLRSGCLGEGERVRDRSEELAFLGSGIVLRDSSEPFLGSEALRLGRVVAVSTRALEDFISGTALVVEVGRIGPTDEERVWECSKRGEVRKWPWCPSKVCIRMTVLSCRSSDDGFFLLFVMVKLPNRRARELDVHAL